MSTIFLDVVELEKPIMFDPKSREQFHPEDSEYQRLLQEQGLKEKDLEKCYYATKVMDASGCTGFDPFPSKKSAMTWIRDNLFVPHVYISSKIDKTKLGKEIGREIPDEKIWQNRKLDSRFIFHLSPSLEEQLKEFAGIKGWKIAFVIREAIKEYLANRS